MSAFGAKRRLAASQPYVRRSGVKPTCQDSSTDAFNPKLPFKSIALDTLFRLEDHVLWNAFGRRGHESSSVISAAADRDPGCAEEVMRAAASPLAWLYPDHAAQSDWAPRRSPAHLERTLVVPRFGPGHLSAVPAFGGLTLDELDVLAAGAEARQLRRGEVLLRRGDASDALYFVLSGRFSVEN